ncbi:MAG: FadR family transcriptional regulator [Spirochaetes bacterium]|nr:MAG: FadR family transcriptional regulator [Spirochaetota bacterium]
MTSAARKLDPVVKSRLHEGIVRQVLQKILAGELKPGEKLPAEREIAESLKVNRATLREALKKLEVLGLVDIRHGDGIYVQNYLESGNLELFREIIYSKAILNPGVLENILVIRRILVPEMAAIAAEKRTDEHVRDLATLVLDDPGDEMLERDLTVHRMIARASGNLFYIFILNFFNQLFRDFGPIYFDFPENRERSAKFHRDIAAAIGAGKADKARKIMHEVLLFTEERIHEYYKAGNSVGRGAAGKGA